MPPVTLRIVPGRYGRGSSSVVYDGFRKRDIHQREYFYFAARRCIRWSQTKRSSNALRTISALDETLSFW